MPLLLGTFLILAGILIWRFPFLIAYALAALLILAGAALVLAGLGVGVTYRRIVSGGQPDRGEG
ncbi:MAG: hypothetical protein CHACPFDD_00621 [Phycisphaerae bacterium]|nr:hypothetical protein [Phycisphaerae bacterium]